MENIIKIKFMGLDEWSRGVYKNIETGKIYKDVDGVLYTTIDQYGEPCYPTNFKYELIKDVK